jgi:two-component system cell cycle sensor histidine kinase/response regulator CckA
MANCKVILVAEDEMHVRTMIKTILHREGYEVLDAANGNEAVELSQTHRGPIDLLLTDVQMPHLDGVSAYQRIRAERTDIKVLFISGAHPESLKLPEEASFLPKPFVTLDLLRSKVREVLEVPA